jgi:hypothetical protein
MLSRLRPLAEKTSNRAQEVAAEVGASFADLVLAAQRRPEGKT